MIEAAFMVGGLVVCRLATGLHYYCDLRATWIPCSVSMLGE